MVAPYAVAVRDIARVPLDDLSAREHDCIRCVHKRDPAAALETLAFVVERWTKIGTIPCNSLPQGMEGLTNSCRCARVSVQSLLQNPHGLSCTHIHHLVKPSVEGNRLPMSAAQIQAVIHVNLISVANKHQVLLAQRLVSVQLGQYLLVLLDQLPIHLLVLLIQIAVRIHRRLNPFIVILHSHHPWRSAIAPHSWCNRR